MLRLYEVIFYVGTFRHWAFVAMDEGRGGGIYELLAEMYPTSIFWLDTYASVGLVTRASIERLSVEVFTNGLVLDSKHCTQEEVDTADVLEASSAFARSQELLTGRPQTPEEPPSTEPTPKRRLDLNICE